MKAFLIFCSGAITAAVLAVGICFFFSGCGLCPLKNNDYVTGDDLRRAAADCGITTTGKSNEDILREFQRRPAPELPLGEYKCYYGGILQPEDWKKINLYLKKSPSTIETLKQYDSYIKEIKGKNVRITAE